MKGGQRTLTSLGHKSDSNLCKQNLVLVLDKYLWDKTLCSKESQSTLPDGQWFLELYLFLWCQEIAEQEELCGYLDAFGTWFYFRAALVVSPASIGTAAFSCTTTKCAEPSSELLEGHLEVVVTHLMVPSLSGSAYLCVLCSCC